jgi:heme-degrading monooxygenase HmoA
VLQVEAPEVGAPDELQVRVGASQVRSLLGLIAEKKVSGYKRIQLLRRPLDNDEVEFVTIMWFDSWDAVKEFAGEDYERSYVPAAAREVLARFDERSQHYEIRESLEY